MFLKPLQFRYFVFLKHNLLLDFLYVSGDCSLGVEEAEAFTIRAVITKEFERAPNVIIEKNLKI